MYLSGAGEADKNNEMAFSWKNVFIFSVFSACRYTLLTNTFPGFQYSSPMLLQPFRPFCLLVILLAQPFNAAHDVEEESETSDLFWNDLLTQRQLLRHFRNLLRRLRMPFLPKLPGDRSRPGLAASLDIGTDDLGEKNRRRMAKTSSAIEIQQSRSATCLPFEDDAFLDLHDEDEPHIGMFFEVYNEETDLSTDVVYELVEPMDKLGVKLKHAADYAYTPVITEGVVSRNDGDDSSLEESIRWWQRLPWWKWTEHNKDHSSDYQMNEKAFAGGSHGEVWRGRRRCSAENKSNQHQHDNCNESLIFKRLKIELGYSILEAGLREVYFGNWLLQQDESNNELFTTYVDHFFHKRSDQLELWLVFVDAGSSLRSFLYTGVVIGDLVFYQHSYLWAQIRMSLQNTDIPSEQRPTKPLPGRQLMKGVLRQILSSAAFLHERGVIHRDIKPSNVMCRTNLDGETQRFGDGDTPFVNCSLGDFSSAWNEFTNRNLYSKGPSRAEQTDEYAPPEAMFDDAYNDMPITLAPAFDSWSIGIIALELLLGTPNVFSVDQRTRVILSHKMEKEGASPKQIEKAMYLAALSQYCIYNPSLEDETRDWPLRKGDPLHQSAMVKKSCTINDFHVALRARDPLGVGFDSSSDMLLHLIWQLLAWDPRNRMTAVEALNHPYFTQTVQPPEFDPLPDDQNALESQMLDPRMDFNISSSVEKFVCPKCGREFDNWRSCLQHARARRHARFCTYDTSSLPTCLNAHSMLPAHSSSGYCDIQGRRRTIEDMHAIHLLPSAQAEFYAIFDGHNGNLASKYAASFVHKELANRLLEIDKEDLSNPNWKDNIEKEVVAAFADIHQAFLEAIPLTPYGTMDQSGTTATAILMTPEFAVIANLGDSRAVISSTKNEGEGAQLEAIDLTKDHVASDPEERALIESRGGHVIKSNGIDRVNGTLAITRSIGDADFAHVLSQVPDVVSFTKAELKGLCGDNGTGPAPNCFIVLASDGLWDLVSSQEAVEMVTDIISIGTTTKWRNNASLQKAAEALTLEAFVRGSRDNIGVCVIAIE